MARFYKRFFLLTFLVCLGVLFNKNVFAETMGKINQDSIFFLEPDKNSAELKKVKAGQAVEILDSTRDFYKIFLDGEKNKDSYAYIEKKSVDIINADGLVRAENVNIRALPDSQAQIISRVNIGDKIKINGIANNWFVISFDNKKAYIAKEFVICDLEKDLIKVDSPKHKFGIVIANDGLNLREEKSIESKMICSLPCDAILDILEENIENKDWIKVAYENNFGYVKSDFIKISDERPEIEKEIKNNKTQEIIAYAKKFIGTPYKYGGRNLNCGVDCSGFVYCVMRNFGVNLNCNSKSQARNGFEINKKDLSAGDLVFFSNGGGKDIQHVGIYIGNNNFIHSASAKNKGVMISNLCDNYYLRNYVTARRVI